MAAQTTTARKSAKDKAADQDQAQTDQPQPEPGPADPPDSSGTPSSDTRHKEDQDQQPEQVPQPEATEPEPGITVEPVPVTYYRPTVSLPAGYLGVPEARTVNCEHKYLHETEKLAAACGRKMAKAGAFVK